MEFCLDLLARYHPAPRHCNEFERVAALRMADVNFRLRRSDSWPRILRPLEGRRHKTTFPRHRRKRRGVYPAPSRYPLSVKAETPGAQSSLSQEAWNRSGNGVKNPSCRSAFIISENRPQDCGSLYSINNGTTNPNDSDYLRLSCLLYRRSGCHSKVDDITDGPGAEGEGGRAVDPSPFRYPWSRKAETPSGQSSLPQEAWKRSGNEVQNLHVFPHLFFAGQTAGLPELAL